MIATPTSDSAADPTTSVATPPSPDAVTCATCGLLAQAHTASSWLPVSARERTTGELTPRARPEGASGVPTTLGCFVGQYPLAEEVGAAKGTTLAEQTIAVLSAPRSCPRWIPYQAGLGPIAHLGDQWAQDLEREQRAFQRGLLDQSQQLLREQKVLAQRTQRKLLGIAVTQALLGVAGIIAAILIARAGSEPIVTMPAPPVAQPTAVVEAVIPTPAPTVVPSTVPPSEPTPAALTSSDED